MTTVAVTRISKAIYPEYSPYHPSESYPEYPFAAISDEQNYVYRGVRQLFRDLQFDKDNFGTGAWNPLGGLIKPGMTVVLKPNFVLSRHFEAKDPYALITHPSVLRAVADYCFIALSGQGEIVIADAPQYNCNWEELMSLTGLEKVRDVYNSARQDSLDLRDLRNYWSRGKHFPSLREELPGDPLGSLNVNLGNISLVKSVREPTRLYGAVYNRQETITNHSGESQNYQLARTIMDADVVISIPKLKTHKKVGVTMNIKGLVGINTNKNLIVHYSVGSVSEGGDQYPPDHFTPLEERLIKTERWMYDTFLAKRSVTLEYIHRSIYWLHGKFLKPLGIEVEKSKRLLDAGNWHGNDTAWRMSVDLLKLITFADRKGGLHEEPQRRLFTVIDGVLGGDNKGPLEPDPHFAGVLIASENLLSADIVGTRLMGFDPLKVKTFSYLMNEPNWNYGVEHLSDIKVVSNEDKIGGCLQNNVDRFFSFRPHPGWVGHIEI